MTEEQAIQQEIAIRTYEARYQLQANNFYEYLKLYWLKEKKMPLDENRHIKLMCDTLERVYRKEISRLIINVPPRSLKTEIVSKAYTNWVLGNDPYHKFIVTSYAAGLAEKNS